MSELDKGDFHETAKSLKTGILEEYQRGLYTLSELQRTRFSDNLENLAPSEISESGFNRVMSGLEDIETHERFSRVFCKTNRLISATASELFPEDSSGFSKTSKLGLKFGEIDSKDFRVMFDPSVMSSDFVKSSHLLPISHIYDYVLQGDKENKNYKNLSLEEVLKESVKSLEVFSKSPDLSRQDVVELSAALLVMKHARKEQEGSILRPIAQALEKFAIKDVRSLEHSGKFNMRSFNLSLTSISLSRSLTHFAALRQREIEKSRNLEKSPNFQDLKTSVVFEETKEKKSQRRRSSDLER